MLFTGSKLLIVDNTAAKLAKVIRILKPKSMFSRRPGFVGNIFLISLRSVKKDKKLKKGDLCLFLLVRSTFFLKRVNGYCRFFENSGILLDKKLLPLGNKIKGPVSIELRYKKFIRILSMSTFVF